MDTEPIDVVVSGFSAEMLSSEIASSLRGRAVEAVVFPFSFRACLRHAGLEPPAAEQPLEQRRALPTGPSAGALPAAWRLSGAAQADERSHPPAPQWLMRQLRSLNRLHAVLKSQGLAITREHLAELVDHLENAFLIRCLSAVGGSMCRRMTLPRQVYPIDPGLLPLDELDGCSNRGHALETVVLLELLRQGAEVGYLRTSDGFEVDVHVRLPHGRRALQQALQEPIGAAAQARMISLDRMQLSGEWPEAVSWSSALEWLLQV